MFSAIMGGFWIPIFLHACFGNGHSHSHEKENGEPAAPESPRPESADPETAKAIEKNESSANSEAMAQDSAKHHDHDEAEYVTLCGFVRLRNLPLFVSYNLGEIFHNFTDGIFVGVAFLGCGRDIQISIVVSTILHELPNQLAGYLVMVNQCGMNPFVALLVNFVFGLSIMLGGLLVLVFNFSHLAVGCLLAMGGGTFLHVAISELLGNAERNTKGGFEIVYMFLAFLLGAVPIGLILLNHEHC